MSPLGVARALLTAGGSVESIQLIETKTFSGASSVAFDDLGDFKIHKFQWNNIHTGDNRDISMRTKVGGSIQSDASTYSRAMQVGSSSQSEDRDPNLDRLRISAQTGNCLLYTSPSPRD